MIPSYEPSGQRASYNASKVDPKSLLPNLKPLALHEPHIHSASIEPTEKLIIRPSKQIRESKPVEQVKRSVLPPVEQDYAGHKLTRAEYQITLPFYEPINTVSGADIIPKVQTETYTKAAPVDDSWRYRSNHIETPIYGATELVTKSYVPTQIPEGQVSWETHEQLKRKLMENENRMVLFMIEIDRLGKAMAGLQFENDSLKQKADQRLLTQSLDTDKFLLQSQNREYKQKIEELESQLVMVRHELQSARNTAQFTQNSTLILELERMTNQNKEKSLRIAELESQLKTTKSPQPINFGSPMTGRISEERTKKTIFESDGLPSTSLEAKGVQLLHENNTLNNEVQRLFVENQEKTRRINELEAQLRGQTPEVSETWANEEQIKKASVPIESYQISKMEPAYDTTYLRVSQDAYPSYPKTGEYKTEVIQKSPNKIFTEKTYEQTYDPVLGTSTVYRTQNQYY